MAGNEVAEDDIWVRRPAFPKVDLQCVDVPPTHVGPNRSKVHAETPDDAALGEELADRPPMTRQLRSIGGIGGEATADTDGGASDLYGLGRILGVARL
jgi:hypothetical protein